jgi:hypothetical protein
VSLREAARRVGRAGPRDHLSRVDFSVFRMRLKNMAELWRLFMTFTNWPNGQ